MFYLYKKKIYIFVIILHFCTIFDKTVAPISVEIPMTDFIIQTNHPLPISPQHNKGRGGEKCNLEM